MRPLLDRLHNTHNMVGENRKKIMQGSFNYILPTTHLFTSIVIRRSGLNY